MQFLHLVVFEYVINPLDNVSVNNIYWRDEVWQVQTLQPNQHLLRHTFFLLYLPWSYSTNQQSPMMQCSQRTNLNYFCWRKTNTTHLQKFSPEVICLWAPLTCRYKAGCSCNANFITYNFNLCACFGHFKAPDNLLGLRWWADTVKVVFMQITRCRNILEVVLV